jgi:hypothetical protein
MLLTTFDSEEEAMRAILRHRPSPAMVVACIALGAALGGTSYAAIRLPAGSVGTKHLKKNAVTSPKVKNNAITGADVRESTLARVPSAANATSATEATHATSATNATHATSADNATSASSATTAGTANAAFSTFRDAAIPLPNNIGTIATLTIPAAGNYVINAKLTAFNVSNIESPNDSCDLTAGGDKDTDIFDADGLDIDDAEVVALQLVHQFPAPGQAVLACTDAGAGEVQARFTRITAVQVAQLTNTPF